VQKVEAGRNRGIGWKANCSGGKVFVRSF